MLSLNSLMSVFKSKEQVILTTTDLALLLRKVTNTTPFVTQVGSSTEGIIITQCALHAHHKEDTDGVMGVNEIQNTILEVLSRYKGFLLSAKFSMSKDGTLIISLIHFKDLSMQQVLVDRPKPTYTERCDEKLGELLVVEYDFI